MPQPEEEGCSKSVTVLLCRHGRNEANTLNVFSNIGYIHGLTDEGIEQSQMLAEILLAMRTASGKVPVALYSSPLRRAYETARVVGKTLGLPVTVDRRLVDFRMGIFELSSGAVGWTEFSGLWSAWFDPASPDTAKKVPGGESLDEISERLMEFMDFVLLRHPGQMVLAVTHRDILRIFLALVMGDGILETHEIGNGDFVILEYRGRDGMVDVPQWRLTPR